MRSGFVARAVHPAYRQLPSFVKLDLNDVPVLYLAVTSSSGDPVQTYRIADDFVRPRLETVNGVGRVLVVGGQKPEVQVETSIPAHVLDGLTDFGDPINCSPRLAIGAAIHRPMTGDPVSVLDSRFGQFR